MTHYLAFIQTVAGFQQLRNVFGKKTYLFLLIMVFLSLFSACFSSDPTCPDDGSIFPQFCDYYQTNYVVLGRPISEYFFEPDPDTGQSIAIQYFEGMRLEYDSSRPEGERIQPRPIGVELFGDSPQYQSSIEGPFKELYETVGESVIGRPISAERIESGRKVQYFENARLRFEPSIPQVMNDTLGQAHMQHHYPEMTYRPAFLISSGDSSAQINGHLSAPIYYEGDNQILYIEVKAGDSPLDAAQISVRYQTISVEDGRTIAPRLLQEEPLVIGQTDQNGSFEQRLELPQSRPGDLIRLEIIVNHQTIQESSIFLSYKTWW